MAQTTCPVVNNVAHHADPHTEIRPSGTVVFTCGACGIRLVD